MDATLRGRWFDGRSSQARPALVRLDGEGKGRVSLRLHPLDTAAAPALELAPGQFEWPDTWEPGGASPWLTVDLGPNGSLQVEGQAWQQALAACGAGGTLAQRLQRRWLYIAGALLLIALIVWAFARWGTPWLAGQLAQHAPLAWERAVSDEALAQLESQGVLKPSRIPKARQLQLQQDFARLTATTPARLRPDSAYAPTMDVQFRSGRIGPNAFALPGGLLVVTDDMVELARSKGIGDEALMGVLAHEAGHVLYRHGTRRVIEVGVLNAGAAIVFGDVSGVVATGGTLLATLAYSRDHEREADCYAIAMMQANGQPLAPMAELLQAATTSKDGKGAEIAGLSSEWLRTHPDTADRVRALKAGDSAGCRRR